MDTERYNEEDFNQFLDELLESGRIEDKEYGIVKLARDKGYESLSEKQRFVFNRVIEENTIESCEACGDPVSWSEMMFVLDDPDHYCSGCRHTWDKIQSE